MPWYEKTQITPFDEMPIDGLFFVDGRRLAKAPILHYLEHQKLPIVVFPSGRQHILRAAADPHYLALVHLFGEFDLPYNTDRDEAQRLAQEIGGTLGYAVGAVGEDRLEVHGFDESDHVMLRYDNQVRQMLDIRTTLINRELMPMHPAHILMTDALRRALPPLYANETRGLEAPVLVKYFHPTSNWTWYASEFDPDNKLFFGLVDGYETELGYFSLAELQAIGNDRRSLPIERDLYYEPQTLQELMTYHCKLRYD